MRRSLLLAACLLLASSCSSSSDEAPADGPQGSGGTSGGGGSGGGGTSKAPLDLASPFVGTGGFAYCFGSAFVGAMSPVGMAKVGPDTVGPWGDVNFLHYSGYWYGDDTIQGFSHLHLHGTGATDYGVLSFMPSDGVDASRTVRKGYQSKFRKETEKASPGFYGVTLDDVGQTTVELTATPHAAHHRYTFGEGVAKPTVIVDLTHRLSGGRVTMASATLDQAGSRFSGKLHSLGGMSGGFGGYDVYFEARASRPWASQAAWNGGDPADGASVDWKEADGAKDDDPQVPAGFSLSFDGAGGPVEIAVGLSLVSAEGAAANLGAEIPAGSSFDDTRKKAEGAWKPLLEAVQIEGGDEKDQATFYSALYHAYVMPSWVGDADGKYVKKNGEVGQTDGYHYVNDLSLWDTYRTLHPLYALLSPEHALDAVKSLHAMAQAWGAFPKWPLATGESGTMLGSSAEVVLADAYVKGVTGFDAEGAYAILRAAAMDEATPPGGRGGRDAVEPYMKLGYVPSSHGRSVSMTGEYAWDDFALSNLARALGKADDADALLARSKGYRKLFDPESGFLRGKKDDGSWSTAKLAPTVFTDDYAEANAWQTVWAPMHDVDGLAELFGGKQAMIDKLTEFFEKAKEGYDENPPTGSDLKSTGMRPYFWASNEPNMHAEYMFAMAGRPDLTQKWVRWIDESFFRPTPDGIPGNDDGGTMSSWVVFNMLGFYPIAGSDRYVIGAPQFPKATLKLAGGDFVVEGKGASKANIYVQKVTLNGAPLDKPEIRHGDIKPGGSLVFEMGPEPSEWGR